MGTQRMQKFVTVENQKPERRSLDALGYQMPEVMESDDYLEPADLVITAFGFEPELLTELCSVPNLDVTRWGTEKAHFQSRPNNLDDVFAPGNIVRSASLLVWAVRYGRAVSDVIIIYLTHSTQFVEE
ncbi:MAG: glutamate synthase (NADPH/NADH) small chain [Paracoccaceae bacterium]|jgi:glutamate synthase (NADPH/NADH) small chain